MQTVASRSRLALAAANLLVITIAVPALAQTPFPSAPVRVIVLFSAGDSGDAVARTPQGSLGVELGQSVIVENRAGGNSVIGTQLVAKAKPDGFTLLQIATNGVIVANLHKDVPYDCGRDFTQIIHIGAFPLGLAVSSSSRVRSIADLVALSKTKNKGVDCASGGVGSVGHLTSARLVNALKIETTHIPYQVIGPAMLDLLANRIDFSFPVTTDAVECAKRGDIRLLAVTAEKRMASLPDVPTMIELGFPDFTPLVWYGYAAWANTPADIVERLYAAFAAAARNPSVEERLRALGLVFNIMGPAEFRKYMGEDAIHWRKVTADNNITAGQ